MIQSNKGDVVIDGRLADVLADLSTFVHSMHGVFVDKAGMTPERAQERILEAVNMAFKSKEEVHDTLIGLLSELGEVIERILDKEEE